MKIYIAHNFAARDWLKEEIIPKFFQGHEITSRWITDDAHTLEGNGQQNALDDLEDIRKADLLVICTDQFGEKAGKGKWFEWGYALGIIEADEQQGYFNIIQVITIGSNKECVFYHLPNQKHFETWEELGGWLANI